MCLFLGGAHPHPLFCVLPCSPWAIGIKGESLGEGLLATKGNLMQSVTVTRGHLSESWACFFVHRVLYLYPRH